MLNECFIKLFRFSQSLPLCFLAKWSDLSLMVQRLFNLINNSEKSWLCIGGQVRPAATGGKFLLEVQLW